MYTTLVIVSDQFRIQTSYVLGGFEMQERKRRGGRTWWVLVTGEGPENGDLGTSRRAAAAAAVAQSSPVET